MRAEVDLLWRLVLQEQNVDLIALGPFLNLVYTDDDWYQAFPAKLKHRTVYDLAAHRHPQQPPVENLDRFLADFNVAANPLGFVIANYRRQFSEFTVCDIGSQYGTSTMATTLFLRALGANARVFSFDPGIAGALAPLNYHNNGFPEINFIRAAVGPVDGFVVLHREFGHSENNRITGPLRSRERGSTSLPVRCARLDTVLSDNAAFGPTIAKIDTQGAEPGVLGGMAELLRQHPVSMLLEYTPGAIARVVKPAKLVEGLLETHYCFDTGVNESQLFEVTAATAGEHERAVAASRHQWVDLLLVAKTLPGADDICAQIRAAAFGGPDLGGTTAGASTASGAKVQQSAPTAQELRGLVDARQASEAAGLLRGVDLDVERGPEFDYYAGMALAANGLRDRAVDLLKRAAAGGFAPFWCAYHLGINEMRRGEMAKAAYYYAASLLLKPGQGEIYPLLKQVAGDVGPVPSPAATGEGRSAADARAYLDRGGAELLAGHLGAAAYYFAIALALDPGHPDARRRLLELAPDVSLTVLPARAPSAGLAAAPVQTRAG